MNKQILTKYLIIFLSVTLILVCNSLLSVALPPIPGFPHRFKGTVTDSEDNPILNGSVLAVVDDEEYQTNIVNGTYGYYSTFYVEDPDDDNNGSMIYFYVNLSGEIINTHQKKIFTGLGFSELNLTIKEDNNHDTNGGGSGGSPSNNGQPSNEKPFADADGPYYGGVNRSITFNASKSYDDNIIIRYQWTFGDDETGSGIVVSHNYSEIGIYNITLLVEDDEGLYDTDETTVEVMFDSDDDGWGDDEEKEYNTDPENSTDKPEDTDNDHIPDFLDEDDDGDGISDIIEVFLGLDSKNFTVSQRISINDKNCYLIDETNDGLFDIFYNSTGNITSEVSSYSDTEYLLDDNGDGEYEYRYNATNGMLSKIEKNENKSAFDSLIIVLIILVILFTVLVVIYKIKDKGGKN